MIDFLREYNNWIEAFHIIAVISWMAGLLYLPRLFVYHCQVKPGSEAYEKFKIMERKLLRGIMNPAMIAVFILGIILVMTTGYGAPGTGGGWLHVKIVLVLFMAGSHMMMSRYRKDFERNINTKTERFYRIFNEIPAVLMVFIVILVMVKPF